MSQTRTIGDRAASMLRAIASVFLADRSYSGEWATELDRDPWILEEAKRLGCDRKQLLLIGNANVSRAMGEICTPGLPWAVIPVESLYGKWSAEAGGELCGSRHLYLADSAHYVSSVCEQVGITVPNEFRGMPDHLSIQLETIAILLEAGNEDGARNFVDGRFGWIEDYRSRLDSKRSLLGMSPRAKRLSLGYETLDSYALFASLVLKDTFPDEG